MKLCIAMVERNTSTTTVLHRHSRSFVENDHLITKYIDIDNVFVLSDGVR